MKVREAVILAAGVGSRLRLVSGGYPKFLVRVKGEALITYPVRVLKSLGIERFDIVIPKGWGKELEEVLDPLGIRYCYIENSSSKRENGYSFLLSRECVTSYPIFVSMTDHIYVPEVPRRLIKYYLMGGVDTVVAADSRPKYVDVEEATKLLTNELGYVVDIGKGLKEFTHVDAGVFLTNELLHEVANELARKHYVVRFADVVREACSVGKVVAGDITGLPWVEVDTEVDYEELLHGLRKGVLEKVVRIVG